MTSITPHPDDNMPEDKTRGTLLADFAPSHDFSRANFNKSYFKDSELQLKEDGTGTLSDSEMESLMGDILDTHGEHSNCRPRAEKIESVLAGARVQTLRQEKVVSPEVNLPVAMVHDWSFTENCARNGPNQRGPKSPLDLYKSLESKVRNAFSTEALSGSLADMLALSALSNDQYFIRPKFAP